VQGELADVEGPRHAREGPRLISPDQDLHRIAEDPHAQRSDQRCLRTGSALRDGHDAREKSRAGGHKHRAELREAVRQPETQQRRSRKAGEHREHSLREVHDSRHAVNDDEPARDQREAAADRQPVNRIGQERAHDTSSAALPKYAPAISPLRASS
jgi:hypothetical protein